MYIFIYKQQHDHLATLTSTIDDKIQPLFVRVDGLILFFSSWRGERREERGGRKHQPDIWGLTKGMLQSL
jgi:hypothetical protein